MSAICPECDSDIELDTLDVDIGDELTCSECGSLLRVVNDAPVELESADDLDDEDDEDDEDEEKDDEVDEDEDDLEDDEDGEDEGGYEDED